MPYSHDQAIKLEILLKDGQDKSLSILEVISKSSNFLEKKGVPNHKTDAEWLIAHSWMQQDGFIFEVWRNLKNPSGKIRSFVVKRGERKPSNTF